MKKLVLKVLVIISFFTLFSCDDDDSLASENYLQITVNGTEYYGTVGELSIVEKETCDEKSGIIIDVGEVEASEVFFRMRLMHYSVLEDFISTIEGNYEIKKIGLEDLCHFDAHVYFNDKTQENYSTGVKSGGVNTITAIQKLEETSFMVGYAIQGNFNFTVVNSIEEEVTVTGKFNVHTIVYQ